MVTKKQILGVLEASKRSCVRITPEPDKMPGLTDCKFGGAYCLPAGARASELEFLAQINFAQLPPLEGFPKQGLLQFFLCTGAEEFESYLENDSVWRQDAGIFQVRWYPEVPADAAAQANAVPEERWGMGQVSGGMSFEACEEEATISLGEEGFLLDLGFEDFTEALNGLYQAAADEDEEDDEDEEEDDSEEAEGYDLTDCPDTDQFCRDFGNWGFKLGGHPALRQAEFRLEDEAYAAYTVLLFQYDLTVPNPEDPLDLEDDTFCFFIKPEDLQAGRFDDLLLTWHNCY